MRQEKHITAYKKIENVNILSLNCKCEIIKILNVKIENDFVKYLELLGSCDTMDKNSLPIRH